MMRGSSSGFSRLEFIALLLLALVILVFIDIYLRISNHETTTDNAINSESFKVNSQSIQNQKINETMHHPVESVDSIIQGSSHNNNNNVVNVVQVNTKEEMIPTSTTIPNNNMDPEIDDKDVDYLHCQSSTSPWCTIPMPKKSYFGFDPPTDEIEWKKAQILADQGNHVLLRRIRKSFPHPHDFLDGDIAFRQLHRSVDYFVDKEQWFEGLAHAPSKAEQQVINEEFADAQRSPALKYGQKSVSNTTPSWMLKPYSYVPETYPAATMSRSPIVLIGYTVFDKDHNKYFTGNELGGVYIGRNNLLKHWNMVADRLKQPIIMLAGLNENWGFLSGTFPERTAKWGALRPKDNKMLNDLLNHKNLLMLVVNQHTNISHPKILTLPRGMPLTWSNTHKMVWDNIRSSSKLNAPKKQTLLFAASSSYGYRPQILKCISSKFQPIDFDGHSDTPKSAVSKAKNDRHHYYSKLGTAIFGLSLPGLGYDCYRTWEILTMGTILVLERGIGLDRTFHRLPVLLLEDFYELTPDLLRQAYVEALYRRNDFEFERLHYSYWLQVISEVSDTKSIHPMLKKFPMTAEDANFTRPLKRYECGAQRPSTCGNGAKKIPVKSC